MKESIRSTVYSIIVFIVIVSIGLILFYYREQNRISELRKVVTEVAAAQSYTISRQLDRSLSTTYALASLLQQYGEIQNFDALADDMINRYGGISSLQLAPDAVVKQIFPLQGNEKAIGHDLLNDPNRRVEVLAAIESKKLTLAGPLNLIQGGVAVIGRYPVYIFNKKSNVELFWGFTIALIKLSDLLEQSNINKLVMDGYNYELIRSGNGSSEEIVFAKSNHNIMHNPVQINVVVPNGQWKLSVEPRIGWDSPSYTSSEVLITFFAAIIISILFYQKIENTSMLFKMNKHLSNEMSKRNKVEKEREKLLNELAQKNKELEEILNVTSHDLSSPLVNVEGFSKELEYSLKELKDALELKDVPANINNRVTSIVKGDISESVKYIRSSVKKMNSLLHGLLTFSRLGRLEFDYKIINMNKLILEIKKTFEYQLDETGTHLEISDLPACTGDNAQINQVFSNLIDNALKYFKPERPGIVNISGYTEDGYSIYCVEDNGIGISYEHQERIFELFHQLDPMKGIGEGLGLSIVRKIVERHMGKIWIESELGKGSKFFVSLPS